MAGIAIAFALARSIKALLYGVTEHDFTSFSAVPAALVAVAIFASLVPMYRAVRIDPARSLREG